MVCALGQFGCNDPGKHNWVAGRSVALDGMDVFCLSVVVMVTVGIALAVVLILGHRISVDPIELEICHLKCA